MIEIYWILNNKDDKQKNKNKSWISEKKKDMKQQKCLLIATFGLTIAFILAYIMIAVDLYFSG